MIDKQIITRLHKSFEQCVHVKDGVEFWLARELQDLLGYDKWQNFEKVIDKAKLACETSKQKVSNHFLDTQGEKPAGNEITITFEDMMLTRYACYLIAQNGDPRKDEIAFAQTYFAVQTRKQEMIEERLMEMDRLRDRAKLAVAEKELSKVLFERGVDGQGFARIRSKGDSALFGGHNTQDMKTKLGVPPSRSLADFLPSVTIKAKDLATEITNFKVKRDQKLTGEVPITNEHVKNNKDVRGLLIKNKIVPENLPPAEDIKKVGGKLKSEVKKLPKATQRLLNITLL